MGGVLLVAGAVGQIFGRTCWTLLAAWEVWHVITNLGVLLGSGDDVKVSWIVLG